MIRLIDSPLNRTNWQYMKNNGKLSQLHSNFAWLDGIHQPNVRMTNLFFFLWCFDRNKWFPIFRMIICLYTLGDTCDSVWCAYAATHYWRQESSIAIDSINIHGENGHFQYLSNNWTNPVHSNGLFLCIVSWSESIHKFGMSVLDRYDYSSMVRVNLVE